MNTKRLGTIISLTSLIVIVLLVAMNSQVNEQKSFACEASCADEGMSSCSFDTCPFRQHVDFSWILLLATIFIAGTGGIGVYLAFAKAEEIVERRKYNLTGLNKEEKQIFKTIYNSESGLYQSEIIKQIEISKVKLTRILDKLEKKNLIERKRRGMSNLVVVK